MTVVSVKDADQVQGRQEYIAISAERPHRRQGRYMIHAADRLCFSLY